MRYRIIFRDVKIFVTNVFLNDIIGVEDLGTSGIIKQKKMAIAINNNEPELNSEIQIT